MTLRDIGPEHKDAFNQVVTHPLQSYQWGEFRAAIGTKVIRKGIFDGEKLVDGFSMTLHPVPRTPWFIGYLPKGKLPTKELIAALREIGEKEKCIFIQLEPNVIKNENSEPHEGNKVIIRQFDKLVTDGKSMVKPSAHPLFTKYTFVLDLTPSEEELLKNMHSKTRYNIRVAQKRGVTVTQDDSEKAFERYLQLTHETTTRQKFYAHSKHYHRTMWKTLQARNTENDTNELTAHLFTAQYEGKILVTWVVFVLHDTLYYPYGASSSEHREVMASNAMMWEVVKWGKARGLKKFDMWGSLGPDADPKDEWYGFHRFKQGYNPVLTEFLGSYDLVIDNRLYMLYKIADKIRWKLLSLKKR